jgi:hypothetical protein
MKVNRSAALRRIFERMVFERLLAARATSGVGRGPRRSSLGMGRRPDRFLS